MWRFAVFAAGSIFAVVLASCAPKPEPIIPEPIYDKFGNLEQVCISDDQQIDPNSTLPPLPRCEDLCDPGEQPTFTAPGQFPICRPIPDDNDGSDEPNDPPNPNGPPTAGN